MKNLTPQKVQKVCILLNEVKIERDFKQNRFEAVQKTSLETIHHHFKI